MALFPKEEKYLFNGSELHVVDSFRRPLKSYDFTASKQIYLGNYIRSQTVRWNGKQIENGESIFENGRVYFPHYKDIKIVTNLDWNKYKIFQFEKKRQKSVSWKENSEYMDMYAIYEADYTYDMAEEP